MLKLAMLSTGEEVLHGDIVDTNASWLSSLLFEQGYGLAKRSTVGDGRSVLVEELTLLTLNNDVLIVNGGLGPTTDDVTTEAAAEVADVELELIPEWLKVIEAFFSQRGQKMPESNVKQAMLPQGATLIDNPIGTACGFRCVINQCVCYFTPGVPSEFKKMVSEQIIPDLKTTYPEVVGQECHRLYTLGSSESELSQYLDEVELPKGYVLGYRSYMPFIEIKVFGPKGDTEGALSVVRLIKDLFEHRVVSIDQPMLERIGDCIEQSNTTLSIAEQCTDGWLSQWLFSEPRISEARGSSWILSSKVSVAMTEQDPLSASLALAAATRDKSHTDIALATGSYNEEQFTIALSTSVGEWAQSMKFNRKYNSEDTKSVISTLIADMLLRYLTGSEIFAQYRFAKTVKTIHLPLNPTD